MSSNQMDYDEWTAWMLSSLRDNKEKDQVVQTMIDKIQEILVRNSLSPPWEKYTKTFLTSLLPEVVSEVLNSNTLPEQILKLYMNFLLKVVSLIPLTFEYDLLPICSNFMQIFTYSKQIFTKNHGYPTNKAAHNKRSLTYERLIREIIRRQFLTMMTLRLSDSTTATIYHFQIFFEMFFKINSLMDEKTLGNDFSTSPSNCVFPPTHFTNGKLL